MTKFDVRQWLASNREALLAVPGVTGVGTTADEEGELLLVTVESDPPLDLAQIVPKEIRVRFKATGPFSPFRPPVLGTREDP